MACDDYWEARIPVVKALIVKYDAALLSLGSGVQEYSLDTGQTRQTVTKVNIASLRDVRNELLNELATLEARVYGAGVRVVPSY